MHCSTLLSIHLIIVSAHWVDTAQCLFLVIDSLPLTWRTGQAEHGWVTSRSRGHCWRPPSVVEGMVTWDPSPYSSWTS